MNAYLTPDNMLAAAMGFLMVRSLFKIFRCDIGDSRALSLVSLVAMGAALYLWRSGRAVEIVEFLRTSMTHV